MYLSLGFRADVKFMIRGNDLGRPRFLTKTPPRPPQQILSSAFRGMPLPNPPFVQTTSIPPYPMCGKKPTKMEIIFLDNLVNSPTSG